MPISTERKPCAICGKTGQRVPVEKLPGKGILWRVSHDDGTNCEWGDYDSIENLRSAKNDNPLTHIECPKCGKVGMIVAERDDPVHRPDIYRYRIRHSDGKKHYVKSEHRDTVLKALGRYIENPDVVTASQDIPLLPSILKKPAEINCPRCKEDGREEKGIPYAHMMGGLMRPYVLHNGGPKHYMVKPEHKEAVMEAYRSEATMAKSKVKRQTRLQKIKSDLQKSKSDGIMEGLRLAKRVINQEIKRSMHK
jgi:endogenous inhibitor of DNA gyrase (YacG/DUF329 family)